MCLFLVFLCSCYFISCAESNGKVGQGFLTVNGVTHTQSYVYHFYEGESINFTCVEEVKGYVKLSYNSKDTGSISTGFKPNSVDMYLKLRRANNDTTLECAITDDTNKEPNTISLHLLPTLGGGNHPVGFEVNGLLLPRFYKGFFNYYYEYHYISEEPLRIRIVQDVQSDEKIKQCEVRGENAPKELVEYFKNIDTRLFAKEFLNLHTNLSIEQSNTTLICTAGFKTVYKITFIYYPMKPYIGGLLMANIMTMYKNNITNIMYEYDLENNGKDKLHLTCNPDSPASKSIWRWNPSEVDYIGETYPNSFELKSGKTFTLIKCERVSDDESILPRIAHLGLIRREKLVPTTTLPPEDSKVALSMSPPPENDNVSLMMKSPPADNEESYNWYGLGFGGAAVLIVVAILGAFAVRVWCQQRTVQRVESQIEIHATEEVNQYDYVYQNNLNRNNIEDKNQDDLVYNYVYETPVASISVPQHLSVSD